jgi:hypothetical protein
MNKGELTLLDKTRAIYKGDIVAGSFYALVGSIFLISAAMLHYFAKTNSYDFLVRTFGLVGIFLMGKGVYLMFFYRQRLTFYKSVNDLSYSLVSEESVYTKYRLSKKSRNRRAYLYITIIGVCLCFFSIFSGQKQFIMGTLIPVVITSAIEFCISLLTEFRLWEYQRSLEKTSI